VRGRRRVAVLAAAGAALVAAGCGGGGDRGPGVVRVGGERPGLVDEAATGFAVGGGRIVTVAHVLGGDRAVRVDGRRAVVTRDDAAADLALLDVRGLAPRPAARMASGERDPDRPDDLTRGVLDAQPGAVGPALVRVLRDGAPRDLPARVVRRVTARVGRAGEARRVSRPALQLDAAGIGAGDSGAPVLDADGRLLGVVFARSAGSGRTAWAVDAAAVQGMVAGQ
jgi:S1-C subfamily serine protease